MLSVEVQRQIKNDDLSFCLLVHSPSTGPPFYYYNGPALKPHKTGSTNQLLSNLEQFGEAYWGPSDTIFKSEPSPQFLFHFGF